MIFMTREKASNINFTLRVLRPIAQPQMAPVAGSHHNILPRHHLQLQLLLGTEEGVSRQGCILAAKLTYLLVFGAVEKTRD